MNIAKYVLESIAKDIVSILINGYGLDVSYAYSCLSNSGILFELEQSPYKLMSTTYDDCLEYAAQINRRRELMEGSLVKELEY